MKKNIIREKSFDFALKIIEVCKSLNEEKHFILANQLMRSGTSIGANVRESEYGESKKDFIHKMAIALKEANETEYWLLLLKESGILVDEKINKLLNKNIELIKIITTIINTSKRRMND